MNQTTSIPGTNHRLAQRFALSTALIAIVVVSSTNGAVLPPDQSYAGKTYPEWMAASWVCCWAIPLDGHHPMQDRTGADTLRNQSGPVWYLWGAGTPVTRNIRIPHDQALFITLDGVACSTVEPPPYYGSNEVELRTNVELFPLLSPSCEIDGVPVPNLDQFEFTSPLFDFYYPLNNIGGVPGSGWAQGIGRGHAVLVHSLMPGPHTIHFRGGFDESPPLIMDVTYQVTVYTRPTITVRTVPGTNQFELSWPVTSGFSLQQASTPLANASWSAATTISSAVNNGIQIVTVTNAPGSRFFRLRLAL